MSAHPSQEKEDKPYALGTMVKKFQSKWDQILEELTNAKDDMKSGDVFAKIDYLTFCDQFCKNIYIDVSDIDLKFEELKNLRNQYQTNQITLEFIDNLLIDIQVLKDNMKLKLQNVNDEYPELAERTLRLSQDLIDSFSEKMETEKVSPTIMTEVKQNLEKDLFLQEMKDSLETLREAREDYVAEEVPSSLRIDGDMIPEDLGEEVPSIDFMLSQLDTAITSCDSALLNREITD